MTYRQNREIAYRSIEGEAVLFDTTQQPVAFGLQDVAAMAADLAGRDTAGRALTLRPLHHRGHAHRKGAAGAPHAARLTGMYRRLLRYLGPYKWFMAGTIASSILAAAFGDRTAQIGTLVRQALQRGEPSLVERGILVRAPATLFGGLEYQGDWPGQGVFNTFQILSCGQQGGRVAIMPAGVHATHLPGSPGFAGLFLNGQSINVPAQGDVWGAV